MKYTLLYFIVLFFTASLNAQDSIQLNTESPNLQKIVKSGKITLINDEIIEFSNLTYEKNEQVKYTNVTSHSEEHLFLPSIKDIDENEVVFIDLNEKVEKDTLFRVHYPEGIYVTKEDFLRQKPSKFDKVIPKGLYGFEKPELTEVEHNNFFYYADSNTKVKKVFAISYQGHLFFQVNAILKNRNKTDRAQESDFGNSFVRVISGGKKYLYTEAELANTWAKGFAYGAVGGTAGYYLAQSTIKGKGIVWDFENEEFNIFKNCKDYNQFMQANHPEGMQKCENQQPDMHLVRKTIAEIN